MYEHLPVASGVYRIYNFKTKKSYIGFSENIRRRVSQHQQKLIRGEGHKLLQLDWIKFRDGFIAQVLELTDDKSRELYYIEKYNSYVNGYNLSIGTKRDEITKQRIREANTGKCLSVETRRKISRSKIGQGKLSNEVLDFRKSLNPRLK